MQKQKGAMIDEYEITPATMMIMPTSYGSKTYSRIVELKDDFLYPVPPIEIIKKSCQYYGSSYDGRITGTRQLIDCSHKVPITIDPTNSIYFFPTASPNKSHCIWISHQNVNSYKRYEQNSTIVTFRNKETFIVPISFSVFEGQLMRTSLLRTKLMQRIDDSERKSFIFYRKHLYFDGFEEIEE